MKKLVALMGLSAVVATPLAYAEVSEQEFNEMKQMLQQALQRINELENTTKVQEQDLSEIKETKISEKVQSNSDALSKMAWASRIKFDGDFRYRFQHEDIDPFTIYGSGEEGDDTRERNRIRARLGMTAQVTDDWKVGFGFASGGDDPVSTNQTLGGGGSTKDINLDYAYFDFTGFENTSIRGGKFKNTMKTVSKSQLQWDGDWRPEGVSIAWENDTFFAQGLGTWLESDSNKGNTEFAYMAQAGGKFKLGDVKFLVGAGYTDIETEGEQCYYDLDDGGCFGNETTYSSDLSTDPKKAAYLYDFEVYNGFAEASFDIGSLPVKLFGDYIENDAADDYESGYMVGFELGKIKSPGDWKLKAYYEDLESNATMALLSNSDFGGGGTNGKGTVLSAGYGIAKNVEFGLTYYMIEKNSDERLEINDGKEFDVDILQADLKFKFK